MSPSDRPPSLVSIDYQALAVYELPELRPLLSPILLEQSLSMVYGPRGIGKTHFVIGLAVGLATGAGFLSWEAPEPVSVLYCDGEMPARAFKDRLQAAVARTGREPDPGKLHLLTPDLLGRAAPDLGRLEDQDLLDEVIEHRGAEVIVLDNLSCLIRSGAAENDAESWATVSDWALRHRAQGRSILFVHHAGKGGQQRGTSRREDLLDMVIALKRPAEYSPSEGARFEVHFEKARHLVGDQLEPFEVQLDPAAPGGWRIEGLEGSIDSRIVELLGLGLSVTDIAREVELNKSNVSRRIHKLRDLGVIPAASAPKRNGTRNKHAEDLPL